VLLAVATNKELLTGPETTAKLSEDPAFGWEVLKFVLAKTVTVITPFSVPARRLVAVGIVAVAARAYSY